jgi:PE family
MSLLNVVPDAVMAAAENLQNIGAAVKNANAAAAAPTTAIAAPAADEVSAAITALLSAHAQGFQAVSAQAASFHDEFVNLLNGGMAQYVSTEAANAQQMLVNAVNAPTQSLLGHPLIGTGQGASAANPADVSGFDDIDKTTQFGPFTLSQTGSLTPWGADGTQLNATYTAGLSIGGVTVPLGSAHQFTASDPFKSVNQISGTFLGGYSVGISMASDAPTSLTETYYGFGLQFGGSGSPLSIVTPFGDFPSPPPPPQFDEPQFTQPGS